MPYNSISDLPQSVKDNYSKRCQKVFMEAWNANHDKNKKESMAFAAAHTAAKNCMKATS